MRSFLDLLLKSVDEMIVLFYLPVSFYSVNTNTTKSLPMDLANSSEKKTYKLLQVTVKGSRNSMSSSE